MTLAKKTLALCMGLVVLFSTLGVAPARTHAQWATFDAANMIQNTLTAVNTNNLWFKEYVLDAIAWALAQQVIQSLTASVVNWISGRNGGGFSLFVPNLPLHLLNVGDVQALSFFSEFVGSNSPFAGTVLSSLRMIYLQGTSGAGFWARNMSTLPQFSRNPQAFIRGDFRQGGWGAWLALTTQPQNNPFMLYQRTEAELMGRVLGAQNSHRSQLNWGRGFLSWCGDANTGAAQAQAQTNYINAAATGVQFVVPPATCMRADGSPGAILTPGAVIHDQLSNSLGTTFDKLVTADEINEILGALMQRLITEVVGDGGLAGVGRSTTPTTRSLITQIATDTTFTSSGGQNALREALNAKQQSVDTYRANWQRISAAAQTARTELTRVTTSSCPATYTTAAQNAITSVVDPVIAQGTSAAAAAVAAQAEIDRLRVALTNATTVTDVNTVTTSIQNLQNTTPTFSDASQTTAASTATNSATAPSPTSFRVSGGTTIDQMNLLATNAQNAISGAGGGALGGGLRCFVTPYVP